MYTHYSRAGVRKFLFFDSAVTCTTARILVLICVLVNLDLSLLLSFVVTFLDIAVFSNFAPDLVHFLTE